jgi:hypothetical protein
MNEPNLKDALGEAFYVPPLEQDAAERIYRLASAPQRRNPRKGLWTIALAVVSLCSISALAYPVVNANMFSISLAHKLISMPTFTMTLKVVGSTSKPIEVAAYNGQYALKDIRGATYAIDSDLVGRQIDSSQRIAINQGNASENLIFLPSKVGKMLSILDMSRRLIHLSDSRFNGRVINNFRLTTDQKNASMDIGVFEGSGKVATFQINESASTGMPAGIGFRMAFDYDPKIAKSKFERMDRTYTHEIFLADRFKLCKEIESHPLLKVNLGRDDLTIYRYERLESGAVFVLYTLSGYHDGQSGSFLRLQDRLGNKWLSDSIAMASELKLSGHLPIAEVFFPPLGLKAQPAELYVMRQDWEVRQENPLDSSLDAGFTHRTIGFQVPASVARVPDWFYFGQSGVTWPQRVAYGEYLQMHEAIRRSQFREAATLGSKLLTSLGEEPIHYGTRAFALLDLSKAYAGLGEDKLAKANLSQATTEASNHPGLPVWFERALVSERTRKP